MIAHFIFFKEKSNYLATDTIDVAHGIKKGGRGQTYHFKGVPS
jgi:hypothetical protein